MSIENAIEVGALIVAAGYLIAFIGAIAGKW